MAQETELWQRVNALGGKPEPKTAEYDRGYNNAVLDVLNIIEAMEGKAIRFAERHADLRGECSPAVNLINDAIRNGRLQRWPEAAS